MRNDRIVYPQQMLVSQRGYLLNMISNADHIPGQEAVNRYEELKNEIEKLKLSIAK